MAGLTSSGGAYASRHAERFDQMHEAPDEVVAMRDAIRRMAHAKRTKLTVMIGFAEMLADPQRNLPLATCAEYGRIIHKAALAMLADEEEDAAHECQMVARLEELLDTDVRS